jgi:hypothetical protein
LQRCRSSSSASSRRTRAWRKCLNAGPPLSPRHGTPITVNSRVNTSPFPDGKSPVRGAPRRRTNRERSWRKTALRPRRRDRTKGKSCSLLASPCHFSIETSHPRPESNGGVLYLFVRGVRLDW